jgi:hypothetical protein
VNDLTMARGLVVTSGSMGHGEIVNATVRKRNTLGRIGW